jgi:threonine dehydrogenase-like Zn-dependent dehydrogenase
MKATCWHGTKNIQVDTVPDPKLLNPRDAIIRVTSTAICGSDLHLYNGFIPSMKRGDILGHEFMGEVIEKGSGVSNLNVGDRVVVPFPIACGTASSASARCTRSARTRTRTRGWPRSCTATRRAASSATRT